MTDFPDFVGHYGFKRIYKQGSVAVRCVPCDAEFPRPEGSVMRSHARNCPVAPREYRIPGVRDS
jgi:hypothetical protein